MAGQGRAASVEYGGVHPAAAHVFVPATVQRARCTRSRCVPTRRRRLTHAELVEQRLFHLEHELRVLLALVSLTVVLAGVARQRRTQDQLRPGREGEAIRRRGAGQEEADGDLLLRSA